MTYSLVLYELNVIVAAGELRRKAVGYRLHPRAIFFSPLLLSPHLLFIRCLVSHATSRHCPTYQINLVRRNDLFDFPSSLFTFRPFRWTLIRLQSSQSPSPIIRQNSLSPSNRVRSFALLSSLFNFPAKLSISIRLSAVGLTDWFPLADLLAEKRPGTPFPLSGLMTK